MLTKKFRKRFLCLPRFFSQTKLPVMGIDLGNTNSCVALMDGDVPRIIENAEGVRTTPSVISFSKEGERLVGASAKRQAIANPESTFHSVKALLGRKFEDPIVQRKSKHLGFKIAPDSNGEIRVLTGKGESFSPVQISSFILAKLKETAEGFLGQPALDALIAVPAHFSEAQRAAAKEAGKLAGLKVLGLIKEPAAVCLAYALDKSSEKPALVFDFGGSSVSASLVESKDGTIEIRAETSDLDLGGDGIDETLVGLFFEEFRRQTGIDLRQLNDRLALQRLREAAEKAKIELSSSLQSEVNLPYLTADASGPKHFAYLLTRAKLEGLVEPLLQKALKCAEQCLLGAGVKREEVGQVLLAGGVSRMPRVFALLEDFFGQKPARAVNPDETVAIGAALHGALLKGELTEVAIVELTPLSLGVEALGGLFLRVVEKDSEIPVKRTHLFSTGSDNQTKAFVRVFEGERELAKENRLLGEFELTEISPGSRGAPQIEVCFEINNKGVLRVLVKERGKGKDFSVVLQSSIELAKEEIEAALKNATELKAEDLQKVKLIEAKNALDFSLEKLEKDFVKSKELVGEQLFEKIQKAIGMGKESFNGNNIKEIEDANEKLGELINEIAKISKKKAVDEITNELEKEKEEK